MIGSENRREAGDLVAIARNASLYDWLINMARPRRLPVPSRLRSDLGLPPPPDEPRWPH
ncbi:MULTISPECIES: hypothetical protein [unclassified Devosia]|uniref:hypothetical protein n=1 Tax=unclassified Devosia TaxID=196773 RepID=UPI0025EBCC04|nr:hypothetical protein [Devosia sp.]MCR6635334.1 hypothetical protein [Devosia sp.]